MQKIAAIVVTYNRKDLLTECIRALIRYAAEADILIIDNNSTDHTREAISPYTDNERVFYYNTGRNLGGAGGYNYGMKAAYEKGYEYFWLMDDDTIVQEDTLKELLKAGEMIGEKQFGYLSSIAYWTDGTLCRMNDHTPTNNIKQFNRDKWMIKDGIVAVHRANFVSFLVCRDAVTNLGYPIKEYFIWGDDSEYSMRVADRYPCYMVSRSTVIHKMKENKDSTGDIATVTDPERIKRVRLSVRNDCCTSRRQGIRRLGKYTVKVFRQTAKVIRSSGPYKMKKVKAFLGGWFAGLFFHPRIEKP